MSGYDSEDNFDEIYDEYERHMNMEESCPYCDATYKIRNRKQHMEKVHKCPHCEECMPKASIPAHVESKHMIACSHCNQKLLPEQLQQHESTHFVRCQYCNENMLKQNVNAHIAARHPFHATS